MRLQLCFLLGAALLQTTLARGGQLSGTQPLTVEGDLAGQMVEGIDRFLTAETALAMESRAGMWHRDLSSKEAYEQSIAPRRVELAKILGVVDAREKFEAPELITTIDTPALVGRAGDVEILAVRWAVTGAIHGEGLLLVPKGEVRADVMASGRRSDRPNRSRGWRRGLRKSPVLRCVWRQAIAGFWFRLSLIDRMRVRRYSHRVRRRISPIAHHVYRPAFYVRRHQSSGMKDPEGAGGGGLLCHRESQLPDRRSWG